MPASCTVPVPWRCPHLCALPDRFLLKRPLHSIARRREDRARVHVTRARPQIVLAAPRPPRLPRRVSWVVLLRRRQTLADLRPRRVALCGTRRHQVLPRGIEHAELVAPAAAAAVVADVVAAVYSVSASTAVCHLEPGRGHWLAFHRLLHLLKIVTHPRAMPYVPRRASLVPVQMLQVQLADRGGLLCLGLRLSIGGPCDVSPSRWELRATEPSDAASQRDKMRPARLQ